MSSSEDEFQDPENPSQQYDSGLIKPLQEDHLQMSSACMPYNHGVTKCQLIRRRTFTKWINFFLAEEELKVESLFKDLADGKLLLKLLEIISKEEVGKPNNGKTRRNHVKNVDMILTFLQKKAKWWFRNGNPIRAGDIVDGNPETILGLIWIIILHFQMQVIQPQEGKIQKNNEEKAAKEALLFWCQRKTAGKGVIISDFDSSWNNGLAFRALIEALRPDLINLTELQNQDNLEVLHNAFNLAEKEFGIPKILEIRDFKEESELDERSIITYVALYYHKDEELKKISKPDGWTELLSENGTQWAKSLNRWTEVILQYITLPPDKTSKNIQDDTEATQSQAYGQWHLRNPTEASHDQQRGQGFPANTPLYPAAQMSHYPTHPTKEPSVVHATGITSTLLSERPMPPSRHENPSYMSGPDQAGGQWHPHRQTEASHDQQRGQGFPSNPPVYPAAQIPQSRHPTKEPSVVPETGITSTPSSERPMPPSRHVNPSNMSGPGVGDFGLSVIDGGRMPTSNSDLEVSNYAKSQKQITDEFPNLPPDKTSENTKDVTEATRSKQFVDIVIEEVSSFNFGMKDLLNVSKCSLELEKPKTLKEKLLYIISKFIMLDRSPYNMTLELKENNQSDNTNLNPGDKQDIESEFIAMFGDTGGNSSQTKGNILHPTDTIVILMNCCDTFVRQALIQKMRTCQLAIPLILPDIINDGQLFLLWPMRHLQLNWKSKTNGPQHVNSANNGLPNISAQEVNPANDAIPIISAIKLGTYENSKSKIMNNILCTQEHGFFFHKHCTGGELSRKFSNGVVELAWYLPGGKDKDSFEECWTLANLRGDAKNHKMQFHLLKDVSSIMIVFISLETIADSMMQPILEQLSGTNLQLIFVFLDPVGPVSIEEKKQSQSIFIKMFSPHMRDQRCSFIAESGVGKERNEATLKIEITEKIKQSLRSLRTGLNQKHLSLENIADQAKSIGFNVDENDEDFQIGKILAKDIMGKLLQTNAEKRKKNVLPLQGKFNSWSQFSKQLHRMEDVDTNKIVSKMQLCRKEQFDRVLDMTSVVKDFIEVVTDKKYVKIKMYFLQWMKIYLDDQSKIYLPEQEQKFHALWNNIKDKTKKDTDTKEFDYKNKKETDKKELDNKKKKEIETKELENLKIVLDDLSFGLEHIFREIGQVYEAIKHEKRDTKFEELANNLTNFAADLLIDGYPLEIMDGDASHLPLTWITAVFERLKDRLEDKRVYVVSVLGIQSSGKSTLLNTMFGLNFTVSAGRCTKGVFAQLISVDKDLYSELGYEYILVLDTEGLRAMELGNAKRKHDNELASFIIGMGAVTIVNNKGENTAEIGDVLQICVHAFLRMQRANNNNMNLQPGCFFAHQNVADVNAESKMLFGIKKLKDQLDEIATVAAKHENVDSDITSFNDVIKFDVNKQIWYFPNLWIGDPPMAPSNPSYSEKVLKLKIDIMKYPDNRCPLTVSKLQERLTDLWKAILNENFVFSFKNSQEVRSYSLLEEKILEVSREFHNNVKIEMHKYINQIKSCESNFGNLKNEFSSELACYICQCQATYKEVLASFFSSSADKDILIQWKSFATNKLEEIVLGIKNEQLEKISTTIDLRKASYENLKEIGNYKNDIEKFVREILETGISSDTSEDELKIKFDKKWKSFVDSLNFPKIKEKKIIREEVLKFFQVHYNSQIAIVNDTRESHCKDVNMIIDTSDYNMTGWFVRKLVISSKERHDIKNEIENLRYRICQHIQEYLKSIEGQDFETHFLLKIKEKVEKQIDLSDNKQERYKLSMKFRVKIISHNLLDALPHFEKMQTKYREENDQRCMVEKIYKPNTYAIFIGAYTQCSKEITAAKMMGNSLEDAILESVNDEISEVISKKLSTDHIEFHSKIKLISKVLKDLKSKEIFSDYLAYIHNTQISLENHIRKYVREYCEEKQIGHITMLGSEANILFKSKIGKIMSCIQNVSLNSTSNFKTWQRVFYNAVKREGSIPVSDTFLNLFDMKEVQVKDISYFKDELTKTMRTIETKNEKILCSWSNDQLLRMKQEPYKTICKDILGCMEQCPFCKCICSFTFTHSTDKKEHSALHHYPSGIAGYHEVKTKQLNIYSCNENQASNGTFQCADTEGKPVEFKNYKSVNKYYSSWDIQPDKSIESLAYWKWVFGNFSREFANHYDARDDKVPPEWKNYSSTVVEASIGKK